MQIINKTPKYWPFVYALENLCKFIMMTAIILNSISIFLFESNTARFHICTNCHILIFTSFASQMQFRYIVTLQFFYSTLSFSFCVQFLFTFFLIPIKKTGRFFFYRIKMFEAKKITCQCAFDIFSLLSWIILPKSNLSPSPLVFPMCMRSENICITC